MADNLVLNVDKELDVNHLAEELAETYRGQGFTVTVLKLKDDSCSLVFDKATGGINNLLGMGLGIKATMILKNGILNVTYSDADWTGKIIGLTAGWFVCLIPGITAAIGALKQMKLPQEISTNITALVG